MLRAVPPSPMKGLRMITTTSCVPQELNVTLLKGGESGEREISLVSGGACAKALREVGFNVTEIDTKEPGAIQALLDSKPDVVFIALHGKDGEDGCVQGLCELMRVPYTGPGVLASALAMDKTRAKAFYRSVGLPTPTSVTINRGEDYDIPGIISAVGEKSVVKPAREGSSLGVSIVDNAQALGQAIQKAFECDKTVLVERFVKGREVTVAVLGNEECEALPVIEIVPSQEGAFYDFEEKYSAGGATHVIPARLTDEETATCQKYGVAAHKALGCVGVSRTDMMVDEDGNCWVIETNTIPGMTPTSLLPDTASRVGIDFNQLCKMLVELALER